MESILFLITLILQIIILVKYSELKKIQRLNNQHLIKRFNELSINLTQQLHKQQQILQSNKLPTETPSLHSEISDDSSIISAKTLSDSSPIQSFTSHAETSAETLSESSPIQSSTSHVETSAETLSDSSPIQSSTSHVETSADSSIISAVNLPDPSSLQSSIPLLETSLNSTSIQSSTFSEITPQALPITPSEKIPITSSKPESLTKDNAECPTSPKATPFFTTIKDWLLLTGSFAPKDMSREFALASHWLLRIGVLIIILGVSFFLGYAIENNLLNPRERFFLTLIAAFVVFAIGLKLLHKKYDTIAQALIAIAILMAYLDFFAAAKLLEIFSTKIAFIGMISTTILASFFSVKENLKSTILFVIFGAYATPILLSTGSNLTLFYYGYITIISIAFITITILRSWPWLAFINYILSFILIVAYYKRFDETSLLDLLMLFSTHIYYPISIVALNRKSKTTPTWILVTLLLATLNFWFFLTQITPPWQHLSLHYLALPLLSLLAALIYTLSLLMTKNDDRLYKTFAVNIYAFLLMAAPLHIDFLGLAIAWSLLAISATLFALKLKNKFFESITLVITILLFFVWYHYGISYSICIVYDSPSYKCAAIKEIASWWETSFVLWLYPLTLAILTFFAHKAKLTSIYKVYALATPVTLAIVIPLITHQYLTMKEVSYADTILTLTMSLYAILCVVIGLFKRLSFLRILGLIVLSLATIKLLFLDLNHVSILSRVTSFIIVGLLLIAGATLYIKFNAVLEKQDLKKLP